jgi:hypothetical protein
MSKSEKTAKAIELLTQAQKLIQEEKKESYLTILTCLGIVDEENHPKGLPAVISFGGDLAKIGGLLGALIVQNEELAFHVSRSIEYHSKGKFQEVEVPEGKNLQDALNQAVSIRNKENAATVSNEIDGLLSESAEPSDEELSDLFSIHPPQTRA